LALPVQKVGCSHKLGKPVTEAIQPVGGFCIEKEWLWCDQPFLLRKETFLRKPVTDASDSDKINRVLHAFPLKPAF
jgi:hypothetical protein